ncbi:MAG: orotate phosphoribosyltransferase [Gemmatimonadota bacterium]|nr:orotate phosphoribosyltransferase [Gemmatimonadota bacterium]
MSDRTALERLLTKRSVRQGDFVLASGKASSYYIDARLATMSAEGQVLVGRLGLAAIRHAGWQATAVGGLTMGADPVAYAIARASSDDPPILDAFSVRKTTKEHGTGRRIEGCFSTDAPVVVVEDVITTGASALHAIEAILAAGGTIAGVLAVVDREEGGAAMIEAGGYPVVALTTTARLGLPSK